MRKQGVRSVIYNWFGDTGLIGYNHTDWHGNARLTSTQAQGLFAQNEYSPFGQMYDESLPACCDAVFDGAHMNDITNGYDMPNRKLHSIQGRWIQPDPAGLAAVDPSNPQSWNRYAYVLNNPLSFVDPTGLDCAYLNDSGTGVDASLEIPCHYRSFPHLESYHKAGPRGARRGQWVCCHRFLNRMTTAGTFSKAVFWLGLV
ncbi:MAG: RHS repeat-associated core domain-containing protein [Terriglobales bacterium]